VAPCIELAAVRFPVLETIRANNNGGGEFHDDTALAATEQATILKSKFTTNQEHHVALLD